MYVSISECVDNVYRLQLSSLCFHRFSCNKINPCVQKIVHNNISFVDRCFHCKPSHCLHTAKQLLLWHFTGSLCRHERTLSASNCDSARKRPPWCGKLFTRICITAWTGVPAYLE